MVRDIRGNPVKGNQENEKANDPKHHPDAREDKAMMEPFLQKQAEHEDRLKTIETHLGIKQEGKGEGKEDQGGSRKIEATVGRKRH